MGHYIISPTQILIRRKASASWLSISSPLFLYANYSASELFRTSRVRSVRARAASALHGLQGGGVLSLRDLHVQFFM
jgi:hypothetical protein